MTPPAALAVPASWVPDYLHGSLRHWDPPSEPHPFVSARWVG